MKQSADIVQILLTELGPFSLIMSMVLAWALFQAFRIGNALVLLAIKMFRISKILLFPITKMNALKVVLLGGLIYINGKAVCDGIQYFEQMVVSPTQIESDTSYFLEDRFEQIIKKHTNEQQFVCIRDSTKALAKEIGCSASDIYLVAYSECGLDPFRIREDGIAAGWIQFTSAGLSKSGKSLSDVKRACAEKDAKEMMRLTGEYVRRCAGAKKIKSATDFYILVFAPSKINAGFDDTLYSGYSNPEYYLNSGLDGYFVESGKVLHLPLRKDGRLTKRDLYASLEYKKAKLSR